MTDHELLGCRPEPLAGYLKALGVFRIVAEQADPDARASWRGDTFVLRTRLDAAELRSFFLTDYRPAAVITPWNGGGGFFHREEKGTGKRTKETEATRALAAVAGSACSRLAPLRAAIDIARGELAAAGLDAAPKEDRKADLVRRLRDELPDGALQWLDAAVLLVGDEPRYPPLLGTGGTDGNLDFATNFHQRLSDIISFDSGLPCTASSAWLDGSLFGRAVPKLLDGAVGQFDPGAAGGTNQGAGFDRKSIVNPWDFVLMVEGALLLAASVSRRLAATGPGQLAFPFSVRSSGIGYPSATRNDEPSSRHEIWLPLWGGLARIGEVLALFREGRARIGRRAAVRGTDFARAIATIGTDRGVRQFVRFGFHARNGLSYFATPLGRFDVPDAPVAQAVRVTRDADLDQWLDNLRRLATGDHAPASLRRTGSAVESALLGLCARGGEASTLDFLCALADAEGVIARAPQLREQIRPVPWLAPEWLDDLSFATPELRLARALAACGLRRRIVPVDSTRRFLAWDAAPGPATVWRDRDLVSNLLAIVRRDAIESERAPDRFVPTRVHAPLADITSLVNNAPTHVDDAALGRLARALSLVRDDGRGDERGAREALSAVPAAFALLALVHHRTETAAQGLSAPRVPRSPEMLSRAIAGDGRGAMELAVRRLRASGVPLALDPFDVHPDVIRRCAAALAFPIHPNSLRRLRDGLSIEPAQNLPQHTTNAGAST